jgi:competence protein ComEC
MDAGRRPAAGDDARLAVAGFTAGVLAVLALPELPPAAWLAALAVPALLPWRGRALYAMLALGMLLTVWRAQALLDQRWPEERYGEEVWVQGHIAALPDLTRRETSGAEDMADAPPSNTWRFLFEPENAGNTGLPQRVQVSWYRTDQILKGGECWRLLLRMKPPHGSHNPGTFDYEGWLFREGIGATATVRAGDASTAPVLCEDQSGYSLLKLRQRLVDHLRADLPDHPAAGLFAALTLGDTSGQSTRDWDLFRATGTSHLVAISGLHLGIVAGFAFFIGRWLWSLSSTLCLRLPAQQAGRLFSLVAALAFALLAGLQPPILRALLMLLFAAVALWSGRVGRVSQALALALFVILLFDPLAALRPGLWLSFAAVASIFYVMMNRLQLRGWLIGLLLMQLMLSVALAPMTLYFFQGMSWVSPLVNLLAVPLFGLLMPFLLLALMLNWLWPWVGVPLTKICAEILLYGLDALNGLVAHLPSWMPATAPAAALLLAVLGTLLLFAPRGLPLRVLGALCFLPLLFPANRAPQSGFDLVALDVGQGLSVVVRTANHTLLYDTGPAFDEGFDAGAAIVAPYLLTQGVRHVDLMMISHADKDHSGGAPAVRRLLSVDDERGALTPHPCHDGQHWEWDGVSFEVLHPDDGQWSTNNGSCVLRIEAGAYAALLPADIEKAAEKRLLDDKLTSLQADVLLAPHHGSRTSSTEDFIDAVQPQLVIHSAAWHSQFHHPHPAIVARYAKADARQVVTGLLGTVSLHVDENGVSAPIFARETQRHFWNAPAQVLEIDPLADVPPKRRSKRAE